MISQKVFGGTYVSTPLPSQRKLAGRPLMHQNVTRRGMQMNVLADESSPSMTEVTVETVMRNPICFSSGQTVKQVHLCEASLHSPSHAVLLGIHREAARAMIEQDFTGGPVVDQAGSLVGFLSEDDLIWKGSGLPLDHYLVPPIFIGAFDLFFFLRDDAKVCISFRDVRNNKRG
jgi:hypothetical protein